MISSRLNLGLMSCFCVAMSACSAPVSEVVVDLDVSSNPLLDPFQKIEKVRVRIDGPERFDDAVIDLQDGQQKAIFKNTLFIKAVPVASNLPALTVLVKVRQPRFLQRV